MPLESQALGTCPAEDGPYYRNQNRAGLLRYETDVTLPTQVNVAVQGGGAFVYTGFSSSSGQQHEAGFQWVNPNVGTISTVWSLYLRVQGASPPNPTSGQWVNGWNFQKYSVPKGTTVRLGSEIFTSAGLNYIVTNVNSSAGQLTVGIRSDSSVNFSALVASNENNIWARKIVSLAYSRGGVTTWPSTDANSYVRQGTFNNSTYTRQGITSNWPNYGCTFQKDGYTVAYDSASPLYGDIVSIFK